MTCLTIKYYLYTEPEPEATSFEMPLLGIETYEGINEKLIPNYDEVGHKVSITKFFDGYEDHRWLVQNLVHISDTETAIYLEKWKSHRLEEFLSQTRKSNRSVISKLQFGTLVEVEFGFIPNVKKLNGSIRTNKRYPDTVHKGEIHKRRLSVVVKADSGRVQVVPITSIPPDSPGDLSICQISNASLADLIGYNNPDKSSYAICRMIKTVALTRVLPPLSRQARTKSPFRDNRYSKKLNRPDITAFRQALSHAVGMTDYYDLRKKVSEYFKELEIVRPHNEKLVAQLEIHKADYETMTKRYDALLEILTDWRMGVSGDTPDQAKAHIEAELVQYLAILNED